MKPVQHLKHYILLKWIGELKGVPHNAKLFLYAIAAHWSPDRQPFPSYPTIAKYMGVSVSTVKRTIREISQNVIPYFRISADKSKSKTYSFDQSKILLWWNSGKATIEVPWTKLVLNDPKDRSWLNRVTPDNSGSSPMTPRSSPMTLVDDDSDHLRGVNHDPSGSSPMTSEGGQPWSSKSTYKSDPKRGSEGEGVNGIDHDAEKERLLAKHADKLKSDHDPKTPQCNEDEIPF